MDEYVENLYKRWPQMLKGESLLPYGEAQIGIFDGWERILERFLVSVEGRVLSQITDPGESDWPLFRCFKQKFGKMRVHYARVGSVDISDLQKELEDDAVNTCYSCGAPGRLGMAEGLAAPRCGKCAAADAGSSLQ